MSAWFTINGIEAAKVVSSSNQPSAKPRDVGYQGEASDGSFVLTRRDTKRDFKFTTRPLSGVAAIAWESLLRGEGHVWSFDVSAYSSKGLAPTVSDGTLVSSSPPPKFGAKCYQLTTDAEARFGSLVAPWTAAVWYRDEGAMVPAWHHIVVRSDGAKWADGVRDDGAGAAGIDFSGGDAHFIGGDPGPLSIDDLILCPYLWADDWARQVFEAGVAFGPTPYVTCAGLMVPEAATRKMACRSVDERVMVANVGGGLAKDVRELEVDLAGS